MSYLDLVTGRWLFGSNPAPAWVGPRRPSEEADELRNGIIYTIAAMERHRRAGWRRPGLGLSEVRQREESYRSVQRRFARELDELRERLAQVEGRP